MTNIYDVIVEKLYDAILDEYLEKMAELDREELKREEEDFEESDFIL